MGLWGLYRIQPPFYNMFMYDEFRSALIEAKREPSIHNAHQIVDRIFTRLFNYFYNILKNEYVQEYIIDPKFALDDGFIFPSEKEIISRFTADTIVSSNGLLYEVLMKIHGATRKEEVSKFVDDLLAVCLLMISESPFGKVRSKSIQTIRISINKSVRQFKDL